MHAGDHCAPLSTRFFELRIGGMAQVVPSYGRSLVSVGFGFGEHVSASESVQIK